MSNLKPLSKPEEMKAVPTTEPILVALEPDPSGEEQDDAPAVTKAERQDTGAQTLQQQLEALQKANATEKAGREAAELAASEARQQVEQARNQVTILKTENTESQYDMMVASLASSQSELASAKAEMSAAYDRADGNAIAEANAKIGRATSKIVNYEGAVAELDARRKQQPRQEQQQQPVQQDIVTQINTNPQLMPVEREWLMKHQDAYGPRNNELNVGYNRAVAKGLQRGTPDYFKYLDEFMGYEASGQDDEQTERTTTVSAPVSRNNQNINGQRVPSQIHLTPEERDLARTMNLSDTAYAENKRKLLIDKQANPERYGRNS